MSRATFFKNSDLFRGFLKNPLWIFARAQDISRHLKRFVPSAFFLSVLCFPIASSAGDYFQAKQVDGRWWLIAPDGSRFISKGVTTVQFSQDRILNTEVSPYGDTNKAKYGTAEAWRTAVAGRLLDWSFNTLGAWSDAKVSSAAKNGRRLAYAPILNFGSAFVASRQNGNAWLKGVFPDVFDPNFKKSAMEHAVKIVSPLKESSKYMYIDKWLFFRCAKYYILTNNILLHILRRLENYYTSDLCTPSRGALLTGRVVYYA